MKDEPVRVSSCFKCDRPVVFRAGLICEPSVEKCHGSLLSSGRVTDVVAGGWCVGNCALVDGEDDRLVEPADALSTVTNDEGFECAATVAALDEHVLLAVNVLISVLMLSDWSCFGAFGSLLAETCVRSGSSLRFRSISFIISSVSS